MAAPCAYVVGRWEEVLGQPSQLRQPGLPAQSQSLGAVCTKFVLTVRVSLVTASCSNMWYCCTPCLYPVSNLCLQLLQIPFVAEGSIRGHSLSAHSTNSPQSVIRIVSTINTFLSRLLAQAN
eukprot:1814609-Amphidinium_carterae.1